MMIYDGLLYSLQMEQHFEQKKKLKKKISGGEFLSHAVKDVKVHPVVTLVIYWGKEKWDAPLCLYEMMDIESAEPVRDVISDFRINLLDMNNVPDEVIDTLQLSLKQVMYFRKYSDDRAKLKNLLQEKNSMFEKVDRDTACFLRELTKTPFPIPKEGETINMCEAVRQMIDEEVAKEKAKLANEKARSKEALAKERVKRKEAVEKEKEKNLKATFSLISEMNPDLSSDEICRLLARKFKININLIRKIVLC